MERLTWFCPNCWSELPPETRERCPNCGAPLQGDPEFFEKLTRALWHPERTRATMAAMILGQLDDPRAVPHLIDAALYAQDFGVREAAVRSLGRLRDPRAIPALALLLRTEVPLPVRLAAVEALGALEDPRAREALRIALNDPSRAVRQAARALWEKTASSTKNWTLDKRAV